MKKTLIAIVALFIALASFGQTDIYKSAKFDGTRVISSIDPYWLNCHQTNNVTKTFEMWVKLDSVSTTTNSYILHTPGVTYISHTPGDMFTMYVSPDTTLHCIFDNNEIHTKIHDTNWHHIAFICDSRSISGYDTTTIYIDGAYQTGGKFTHVFYDQTSGCSDPNIYIFAHSGGPNFYGNMCKFSIADSAIYDTFPNCVFDTTMFWSGGTISAPYNLLISLSTDTNMYYTTAVATTYTGSTSFPIPIPYTLGSSPCAPSYTFYCPASIGSTVTTHQTNKFYKKGSHMAAHRNGWDTTVVTGITYGLFTDSLTITSAGTYQYRDDYHVILNTDTIVVVGTAGINSEYTVNGISIYPNPSTGTINIVPAITIELAICDLTGHMIYKAIINDRTKIALTPGLYLFTMLDTTTNETRYAKVLIE